MPIYNNLIINIFFFFFFSFLFLFLFIHFNLISSSPSRCG